MSIKLGNDDEVVNVLTCVVLRTTGKPRTTQRAEYYNIKVIV